MKAALKYPFNNKNSCKDSDEIGVKPGRLVKKRRYNKICKIKPTLKLFFSNDINDRFK